MIKRNSSDCGGGEIRTHGPVAQTSVFKTDAIDHSATPPHLALFHFVCVIVSQKRRNCQPHFP